MSEEKILFNATLCFLVKDDKVLLALKTEKIGKGCWNGYGGGIEARETPEESVLRELQEEAKVKALPENLEKVATILFHNTVSNGTVSMCKVHVYLVHQWQGEPQATETMIKPTWYEKENLPLEEMMPADRHWLPIILGGRKITAEFHYSPFQKELLKPPRIVFTNQGS